MNSNMLLPFALIASAKKSRRKRLTEAMIPAMIPVPAGQHVLVSSVMADSQVRREERRVNTLHAQQIEYQQAIAHEIAIFAEKFKIPDNLKGNKIKFEKLADLPRITDLLNKNPALKDRIVSE